MFPTWLRLKSLVALVSLLLIAACDLSEPIEIAGVTFRTERQMLPSEESQPICQALENAGYIMPYGPPLRWYDFRIARTSLAVKSIDTKFSLAQGEPTLFVLVNWPIPVDWEELPSVVSQETIDQLAGEAKHICRIVQQEARKQGIGTIAVSIRLWDLVAGTEIDYGRYDTSSLPNLVPTSDCDLLSGVDGVHSVGLNPQERTTGLCPSLYVPN